MSSEVIRHYGDNPFTRPDSGASFVSYPAPTYSAAKGMFDCVARWKTAHIRPTKIEICKPLQWHRYATNYGGPLRKGNQIAQGSSYQLFATILIDVCYKVYGVVTESTRAPDGNNQSHTLQSLWATALINQWQTARQPRRTSIGDEEVKLTLQMLV